MVVLVSDRNCNWQRWNIVQKGAIDWVWGHKEAAGTYSGGHKDYFGEEYSKNDRGVEGKGNWELCEYNILLLGKVV